jgi:hypothetical protein
MGKTMQSWGHNKIKGGAGAVTFGAGGRLARRFIGGKAQRDADKMEQTDYAKTARGKLHLKTLRKIGDSSFDARNTEMGKKMGMGTGIKGGYKTKMKKAEQAEIAYGESLKGNIQDANNHDIKDPVTGKTTSRAEDYAGKIKNRSFWSVVTGNTSANRDAAKIIEDKYTNKRNLKETQTELKRAKEKYEDERKKIGNALYSNQAEVQQEVDNARNTLTDFENKVDEIKEEIKKSNEKAKTDSKPKDKK